MDTLQKHKKLLPDIPHFNTNDKKPERTPIRKAIKSRYLNFTFK